MAQHVAGAVDARPLAVPDGEHAVVLVVAEQAGLLRAPDGGGRQVLVDAGLEVDLVVLQELPRPRQRLVEAAERRAAIAGDEAGGVQPGRLVALPLHHRQPHQRLGAGQIDAAGFKGVFVVERDGGKGGH